MIRSYFSEQSFPEKFPKAMAMAIDQMPERLSLSVERNTFSFYFLPFFCTRLCLLFIRFDSRHICNFTRILMDRIILPKQEDDKGFYNEAK